MRSSSSDVQHQAAAAAHAGPDAWDLSSSLETTLLYQAARTCFGRGAFGFGASVTDSAPAEEVVGWLQQWTAGRPRVQALVMQAFELAAEQWRREQQALLPAPPGFGGLMLGSPGPEAMVH
mmetsp:Transcript_19327/g.41803  ORF Transcript_19327/g.41803 Transcript_19327/m.41803 type:complete len:121 (-) Transcript_19327:349-711(-)